MALDWIPPPSLAGFFLNFVILASGVRFYSYDLDTWGHSWHMPFAGANYLCFLVLALLLWPAIRGGRGRGRFPWLIGILVLVPCVSLFLYSRFVQPFWQPRYIGFVGPLLFAALGYGFSLSDRKFLSGAAVAVLLVLNLTILDFYYSDRVKKPWDELVAYISPRVGEGTTILFPHKVGRRTFKHFWELDGEPPLVWDVGHRAADDGSLSNVDLLAGQGNRHPRGHGFVDNSYEVEMLGVSNSLHHLLRVVYQAAGRVDVQEDADRSYLGRIRDLFLKSLGGAVAADCSFDEYVVVTGGAPLRECTVVSEELCDVVLACRLRVPERGSAALVSRVRVGALRQKRTGLVEVPFKRSHVKRRAFIGLRKSLAGTWFRS